MAVQEGQATFPATANDVLELVEKIAVQNIEDVKSYDKLDEAVFDYEIKDGTVIEEAIIEMAKEQAFDKNAFDKTPIDPKLQVLYFDKYDEKQFGTTTRMNDIRKVIANKGVGAEELASKIVNTITTGADNYNFTKIRETILGAAFKDYSATVFGGNVPQDMDGVIFAARDMFNHLKSNNKDLTTVEFISATPINDIRVAIPERLLNLIDVTKLANTFQLSKNELFGMIIPIPDSDLTTDDERYTMYVYDRKAIGRATRLFEYSQDKSGKGLYTNHYLTVSRAYFHNGLFKGAKLNCKKAGKAEFDKLIGTAA